MHGDENEERRLSHKTKVTTERNIRIHGLKLKKPHQSYNYIKNSNAQASRRRLLAAIIVFRNAKI